MKLRFVFCGACFCVCTGRQTPVTIDYSKQSVWELGVAIHEAATGDSPFVGEKFTFCDKHKNFVAAAKKFSTAARDEIHFFLVELNGILPST